MGISTSWRPKFEQNLIGDHVTHGDQDEYNYQGRNTIQIKKNGYESMSNIPQSAMQHLLCEIY